MRNALRNSAKKCRPRNRCALKYTPTGFTLIETIIYIGLLSIILSGTLVAGYYIIDGSEHIKQKIAIDAEANFILRKIDWALTGISAINSPAAGTAGASLSVTKLGLGNLDFDISTGNLRLNATPLNSSSVTISNLSFEHIAEVGKKPAAVKASFEVNGRTFETTKYLRK